MIMYRKNHESETSCILIECDHEVTKEVISLFKKYKIRKKVRKLKEVIRKFVKILKFFNFGLLYFFSLRMYPLDCDFCYINDEHFFYPIKLVSFFFAGWYNWSKWWIQDLCSSSIRRDRKEIMAAIKTKGGHSGTSWPTIRTVWLESCSKGRVWSSTRCKADE